jgi:hypothetical protein
MFVFGGEGGARFFINDSVSIDPGLMFLGFFGGGDVDTNDYGVSGFNFLVVVELSGWA